MSDQRIHLGAHKTATTHLQMTLAQMGMAPALDDFRAAFWRSPEDRRIFGRDILGHRRWSAIRKFRHFPVLSDENILCEAHETCRGYDRDLVRHRMRKLAASLGGKRPAAFLSVRNPADFAASVYSEALRHRPEMVDRSTTKRAWGQPGNWFRLIEILHYYFDLTIWRYEDYRQNRHAITQALAGRKLPECLPHMPDPPQTKRLTLGEIQQIERRKGAFGGDPEDVPAGTIFQLFDDEEKRILASSYADELRQIAGIAEVLSFDQD